MSEDSSTSSSVDTPPTVVSTEGEEEQSDAGSAAEDFTPVEPAINLAEDPNAAEKSLELKQAGNEFLLSGKHLRAISKYTQALKFTPDSSVLLANRAQAYIKVENYGLAVLDSDAAIEIDPKYAKAYYRRASANFALQKYKLARKDFRAVAKLKPKDKDARSKLSLADKAIKEEAFAKAIQSDHSQPLSATYDPNVIAVDDSYQGPHPAGEVLKDMEEEAALFTPGKLPIDFVTSCMDYFRNQKNIHRRYVARLLMACETYFESLPSLMEIEVKNKITVCGDTHGQYYDVLHVFELNGMPSADNPYLFNGDFVDRGSFSAEVILTFLLFKMSDPTSIYLTRGNHETKNMNRIYGFEGEVKHKYDDKIFELFLEVFSYLPLSAVLNDKVFIAHGGIPTDPTVLLSDIRSVPRGMEPGDDGLMSDLLWSDPQPFEGKAPSKRGVGFSFGPDITAAFLERNELDLLVRSHEVKEEGYLVEHGGKCITVFSAPNYCDSMGNKAAFITFSPENNMEPKLTQYEAVPHPQVRPMAYAAGMGGLFA